ncbi:hypothetical protein XBFFL1_2540016 [Xenorhabdus bovienii str. feltiae Florida]|uniref:Uncharacterized protein n=2 Tax=Xenorhabdus bovienii TaxID=40576 RepID=A0A0B6X413_XENBV|nr:hypothetical protein XBFFR1_2360017 [Xenorhabdus bovienii str. feltiae France]CDG93467.1 hypothetical protein XBFFL1_2540016 [Xenorhabdus bovienii str. feltiae Florida]CDH25558.1 hypothetical protein XBKB1_4120019 [Xenorhabdus bovienii str. kraussei Becker Underwood]CDM87423.1 conserved protein of unknown function [Xenorhabdus bovienii]
MASGKIETPMPEMGAIVLPAINALRICTDVYFRATKKQTCEI